MILLFDLNISTMCSIEISQTAPLHSDFLVYLGQLQNLQSS